MAASSKRRTAAKGGKKAATNRPRTSRRKVDQQLIAALSRPHKAGGDYPDAGYDLVAAQRAIDDGADINCAIDFSTALIEALADSKHGLIEWLLAQPAISIDQPGRYSSPLSAAILGAARTKDRRWVDRLFELGADASWANDFGQSALTDCVRFFPDEVPWLDRLITPTTLAPRGAMKKWQPINMALEQDACTAFFMLRERGATLVNPAAEAAKAGASKILARLVQEGGAAVVRAAFAEADSVATAQLLLDAGADINALDNDGYSALYHSCARSNLELTRFLLERGASVHGPQGLGQPLVFVLAVPPTPAIADLLVAHGADLTTRDKAGETVADACREMIEAAVGVPTVQRELRAMVKWLAARGVG